MKSTIGKTSYGRSRRAFLVFPSPEPTDRKALVFAHRATEARSIAKRSSRLRNTPYTELRVWRAPDYDRYASRCPELVDSNDNLPAGAPPLW